jgi:hypothetical protein
MTKESKTTKRKGYRKWTESELKIIKEMWPTDCTALAISGRLKRSLASVMRQAHHLGLKKDKLPGNRKNGIMGHANELLDNFEEFTNV